MQKPSCYKDKQHPALHTRTQHLLLVACHCLGCIQSNRANVAEEQLLQVSMWAVLCVTGLKKTEAAAKVDFIRTQHLSLMQVL